jgi:uncharacterized protein (DUF58 family)
MLGSAWLLLTLVFLIIAIFLQQTPLLILSVLFFLTSGIARLWARFSLTRVEYHRHLSARRVFFGDTLDLTISVANRKFLPLPWLQVEDEIPAEVTFLKGKTRISAATSRNILSNFISLGWYHRLTRHYPLRCTKRGLFFFGPVDIKSGDPFGFFRNVSHVGKRDQLLVYPRIVSLESLGIPSRHPFGDLRVRRHLFEDPVQTMTTREYIAGDPLKHIHWKTTARLQQLQTRVFEHTTTVDLALFLDTRTVADTFYWNLMVSDYLETAILAATALAQYAIDNDYQIGLYANEYYHYSNHLIRLPPASHPDQFKEILGALAQVKGLPALNMEKVLFDVARNLPWETTIVLVTAVLTDDLVASLRHFQKAGRRVALVLIGPASPPIGVEGILQYRVSPEIYRRELASLRLEPEK